MGQLFRSALIGVAIVAAAGCGTRRAPPPARPITVLPSQAMALSPTIYMQLAASSSLFAIRASELAELQARDGSVRQAARSVIQDQRGVASQLNFAGRRLDLLPSAALSDQQAADLERLRQSGDFDRDYRRLVGQALARALEAHEVFARAGSSPTLRPVAGMAAPITRRNLERVRGR